MLCYRRTHVFLRYTFVCKQNKFSFLPKQNKSNTSNKRKKIGISYSEVNFNETDYYFENGLRKVYPYNFTFSVYCKKRWIGRNITDVFSTEFYRFSEVNFIQRLEEGKILVNGKKINAHYLFKESDLITSLTHHHELPVLAAPIKVIHDKDDIVVINKPHSLPVHPTGMRRHNTVLFVLAKEHDIKGLYLNHRLDRLTSGVLIFQRTNEKCKEIQAQMLSNQIKKVYICRVDGEFPDGDIICDQPLKEISHKVGISIVSAEGKKSCTKFRKLSYNGESSVVLCEPLTGRMHQIRVHLQFLGYPIVNDILYNSDVFGPQKGKNGLIGVNFEDLLNRLLDKHATQICIVTDPSAILEKHSDKFVQNIQSKFSSSLLEKYIKDPKRLTFDNSCHFCNTLYKDPPKQSLMMLLHALKYEGPNWNFETEMPEWASEHWLK